MIKILHYTPGFLCGGIESRLLDWYRNIDRTKIQFQIVKLNNIDDTDNIKEFVNLGGKYHNLNPFNLKYGFKLEKEIYNVIINEGIDIIHVHDTNTGLLALRAAKKAGIKCRILHSRTTDFLPNEKNKIVKQLFMKLAPKYATDYFACSYEAGVFGCGYKNKDKVVIIKNGIQDDYYCFNEDTREQIRNEIGLKNKFIIGSVSRLSRQKNIPFLLHVFSEYSKEDPDAVLLLVGDGETDIIDQYLIENPLIQNKIILVGAKKNIWDYYMAMDIFCGTSFYEGFGTTAIEAQASGLPTIISVGFPSVVEVSSFVKRLEISDLNIPEWINSIKFYKNKRFSEEGLKCVVDSGYTARKVSKYLEEFYFESVKKSAT